MSARAHIDLSQNIRNMLELPLQSYLTDQQSIKIFVTYEEIVQKKATSSYLKKKKKCMLRLIDDKPNEGSTKYKIITN
jgi:hypothetical protein